MSDPRAQPQERKLYEEYAYILDYMQYGRAMPGRQDHLASPTVQLVGENYLTLLEAELKAGTEVAIHERVYIGKEHREKVNRIKGRISYSDLTATAKAELPTALEKLVTNQEERFVTFFNHSQAVTPRMHALELLPGIGKKTMWQIINARDQKNFVSFDDITLRTSLKTPVRLLAKRIIAEMEEEQKYRLFSRAT